MDNKKIKIVSIISIIALALTLVAATYAYFVAQTGEGAQTDIKINANTVDTFTFEAGSALNLSLNQENFASGKGNQRGTTFAKAMLSANNKTNTATEHYYLYLNISNNTFTYSIDNNTPEILLSIKDGSNNEITSVSGLTYKTVTDGKGASIKGFDITTKSGLITILNNREITTTSTKTEQWNVTVTFVNYNANQAGNAGKSFSAKLMIQQEKILTVLSDVCTSGNNLASCVTTLLNKSEPSIVNIYHHTSSLANGAGDNSYRYAGANPNNFVCFGSDASPCPTDNLYRIVGVFGENNHGVTGKQLVKLIKYDYATSALLGTDGDYEGSETPIAPYYNGSLTSIDRYYWNNVTKKNTWSESNLNKTNLNTNFINNIGTTWANKIETTTWKVGGNTYNNILRSVPATVYQNEIVNPVTTNTTDNKTEYSAKIGLMYASDYGFAAVPGAWTTTLVNYSESVNGSTIRSQNWMYMGDADWTISRDSGYSIGAFRVEYHGELYGYNAGQNAGAVRPYFNLLSSTTYLSGAGSKSDPLRIN